LLLRLVGVFATLTITDVLEILSDIGHREIARIYGSTATDAGRATGPNEDGAVDRADA
jgi:hypothetical protein